MTHSFVLKGEEPPVCIPCDEVLIIEPILLFYSDVAEVREQHSTALSLRMVFEEVSLDFFCDYLKQTNMFGTLSLFVRTYYLFFN